MSRDYVDIKHSINAHMSHYAAVMRPDLDLLPVALNNVESCMEKQAVHSDDRIQIQILCEEILSNALFATADRNPKSQVLFHCVIDSSKTIIHVFDMGGGIDKKHLNPEDAAPAEASIAPHDLVRRFERITHIRKSGKLYRHSRFGRGLRMIQNISDILEVLYYDHSGRFTPHRPNHPEGTLVISTYIHKNSLLKK